MRVLRITFFVLLILILAGSVILNFIDIFIAKISWPTANRLYLIIAIPFTILVVIFKVQEWKIWWSRPKGSRRGGINKIIPEDLVSKLEGILKNSGMDVVVEPAKIERSDEFNIPQFRLICSVPDSDKVVVYFIRSSADLEKLIICLQPVVSKWWRTKPDLKTLNQICSILEENGAINVPCGILGL